jgi:hypothetical protein
MLHGVLCADTDQPADRLHPARRRILTVLPVAHLAPADALPELLARIEHEVAPDWWSQPGAGLVPLPATGGLLAAVDAVALRELLDWIAAREAER